MSPPASPDRRPRRVRAVVLGVLVALVALEVVLQLGHAALVLTRSDAAAGAAERGHRVLCVGDSFTFGIGASSRGAAYPAALQQALRENGDPAWEVFNEGWPGRNSRELLERLGSQIDRLDAGVVCVLVGTNDRWSHPPRLEPDAEFAGVEDGGFQLRWRTLRLGALVWDALFGEPDAPARTLAERLPGSWAMLGDRVDFVADGTGSFGGASLAWRSEGDALEVECPGRFHVVARVEGDDSRLRVISEDGQEIDLESVRSMLVDRCAAALQALDDGKSALASKLLLPLVRWTRDEDDWAAKLHRVAHHVERATGGDAAQHAAWLTQHGSATELQPGDDPRSGARGTEAVEAKDVLRDHLERVVALCRARGATPVLITYPHDWDFLAVHRDVAARLEVSLVETWPAFRTALTAAPGLELYVPDGHCNDAGYALLAEQVAAVVVAGR